MPRGASSRVELAIETNTTGACWPWNLSTVPTATSPGSRERSIRTCALYGATTRMSLASSGRVAPSLVGEGRADAALRPRPRSRRASSSEDWLWPSCGTGSRPGAVAAREAPTLGHLGVIEAPVVVGVRGERAELRPEAPGLGEEEPSLRGHGLVVAEEVLEHREPRPLRVRALRDLRQLVRVAEQDEGARSRPDREHVGERELAGLVDEEHVERPLRRVDVDGLAREGPRRYPRRAGTPGRADIAVRST